MMRMHSHSKSEGEGVRENAQFTFHILLEHFAVLLRFRGAAARKQRAPGVPFVPSHEGARGIAHTQFLASTK